MYSLSLGKVAHRLSRVSQTVLLILLIQLEVTGKSAGQFLELVLVADVQNLPLGHCMLCVNVVLPLYQIGLVYWVNVIVHGKSNVLRITQSL